MPYEELVLLNLLNDQAKSSSSFKKKLKLHSRRLRQTSIHRVALFAPGESAFARLYNSKQDDALVTLCGFDHNTFSALHEKFKVPFDDFTPYSCHGKR
jgi:hypothetical protein